MNVPTKSYSFTFNSDGSSTSMTVDLSLTPIKEDFVGNLPVGVVGVEVTFTQTLPPSPPPPTSPVPGVNATLTGQKLTITFAAALPELDVNSNLVVYTASFVLQYPA